VESFEEPVGSQTMTMSPSRENNASFSGRDPLTTSN
jgi:hypothetical protein